MKKVNQGMLAGKLIALLPKRIQTISSILLLSIMVVQKLLMNSSNIKLITRNFSLEQVTILLWSGPLLRIDGGFSCRIRLIFINAT